MKAIKIFSLFLTLTLACSFIYLSGCTSAESTTGKLAFQQKDYVKAEVELKKGLVIDKNDAEGWYMLGYSQVENGHYADAQASFSNARRLSAEYNDKILAYWIDKYNAGASSFDAGNKAKDASTKTANYKTALNNFEAAYNIQPDSIKGVEALARSYFALGDKDKALALFETVIQKTHSKESAIRVAAILYEEGSNLLTAKKNDDAAATFKRILSISALPKDDQYYEVSAYNYGLAKVKAAEEMKAANPDDPNLKTYYMDALTVVEPLSQTTIGNEDIRTRVWDLLVVLYGNTNQQDKAKDAYEKSEALKKK